MRYFFPGLTMLSIMLGVICQNSLAADVAPPPSTASTSTPAKSMQSQQDRAAAMRSALRENAIKKSEQQAVLNQKFKSVNLQALLTPESLTSKVGLDSSRKAIQLFSTLLAQRDALMQENFTDAQQIFRSYGLPKEAIAQGLAAMQAQEDEVLHAYKPMTEAQSVSVRAIGEIVDFSSKHFGRMTNQNGSIVFSDSASQVEFSRLASALKTASEQELAAEKVWAEYAAKKQAQVTSVTASRP